MNRQQMLAILGSMTDEKLLSAVSAAGIPVTPEDQMDLGMEEPEGLQSWNAREVPMMDPQKPAFFDKKFSQVPQQGARPQYANPMDGMDDMTPWMPQMGDGTV